MSVLSECRPARTSPCLELRCVFQSALPTRLSFYTLRVVRRRLSWRSRVRRCRSLLAQTVISMLRRRAPASVCHPTVAVLSLARRSALLRPVPTSVIITGVRRLTADDRCRCYQMSFRFRGAYHVTSPRGLHPRQGPLTASDLVLPSVDHYSSGPQTTLLALPRRLSRGCRRELPLIMAVFTLASHRVAIGENFARQLVLLMEDS